MEVCSCFRSWTRSWDCMIWRNVCCRTHALAGTGFTTLSVYFASPPLGGWADNQMSTMRTGWLVIGLCARLSASGLLMARQLRPARCRGLRPTFCHRPIAVRLLLSRPASKLMRSTMRGYPYGSRLIWTVPSAQPMVIKKAQRGTTTFDASVTTRSLCSISSAIVSAASCARAMCTAPMAGKKLWLPSSHGIGRAT